MVIYLNNLYIFVLIRHNCLAIMSFALGFSALSLSICVMKRFWCILQKDQEKVQDELKMKYSESPSYMKFHSVCSQLKDSIVQQKEKVKMIEKKMMKKYSQDSSYRLVVQVCRMVPRAPR